MVMPPITTGMTKTMSRFTSLKPITITIATITVTPCRRSEELRGDP
jgi:hypothetical protein